MTILYYIRSFIYYQLPLLWYGWRVEMDDFNQSLLLSVGFSYFVNVINSYYTFIVCRIIFVWLFPVEKPKEILFCMWNFIHPTLFYAVKFVVFYCPLILDWIELTQAQIPPPPPIHNGDTELNYKYCLKEYFNIVYSNAVILFRFFDCNCILSLTS